MRSTFKLLFYINRNKVKSDGTTAVLYYLFGKDIGCALLCRIFRILKRILVWN